MWCTVLCVWYRADPIWPAVLPASGLCSSLLLHGESLMQSLWRLCCVSSHNAGVFHSLLLLSYHLTQSHNAPVTRQSHCLTISEPMLRSRSRALSAEAGSRTLRSASAPTIWTKKGCCYNMCHKGHIFYFFLSTYFRFFTSIFSWYM